MLIYISLIINILVAGFWGVVLFRNTLPNISKNVFGLDSQGLRILSSIYITIALFSAVAIFSTEYRFNILIILLPLQIVYKLISPFAVGTFKNPVVISNIIIAFIHSLTLYYMYIYFI